MSFFRRLSRHSRRIVLVTPPSSFPLVPASIPTFPYVVMLRSMTPLIPLGSAYLAASLEQAGFEVKIADMTFTDRNEFNAEFARDAILRTRPDVVGLSALTWTIPQSYALAKLLREKDRGLTIVAGGPHVSALPERTLGECTALDAVIAGEGEHSFRDFLTILFEKGLCSEMSETRGVMVRHKGEIIGDPTPAYVEDVDSIPFPARHAFNLESYLSVSRQFKAKKTPVGSIITSRGCPHQCIFCTRSNSGHRYRPRSAQNVVKELELLKEQGFNEVQIPDDNFSQDRERVFEICRLIKERGLDMSFDLPNGVRVDRIDQDVLSAMYDAGFYAMHLGVESGDDAVLMTVKKGITVEQVKKAIRTASSIGYKLTMFLILGLPGSSVRSEEKSLDLVKEMGIPFTFSVCTPYPGSQLWDSMSDKLRDVPWDRYDETNYVDPIYVPEKMTKLQLLDCVEKARALQKEQGSVQSN